MTMSYVDWVMCSLLCRIVNVPKAGRALLGRRFYLCEKQADGTYKPFSP